jgi:hypothetical protein
MAELPASNWTDEQFLEWLKPAFEWLADDQWASGEDDAPYPTWEDTKDGFLGKLDLRESELDTTPELRVLQLLVSHVDEDLYSDDERREFLLNTQERESKLSELVEQWQEELGPEDETAEAADGDAPDEPEVTFVEGRGWMRLDPDRNEWVDTDPPASADGGAATADATDASAVAPAADAETVSAAIADQVAAPALEQLLAARPDLAALPREDLQALVGSVIADRLAAAS